MTTIDPAGLPPYVPPTAPRTVHPARVVAFGAGLAVALVAGAFGVVSIAASSGADSPEAAVEALFDAVEQRDGIGVLETLVPEERRPIQDGLEDVSDQLERLGVLDESFDLGAVDGIEIDIEGLELSAEDLGDGIVAVHIDGGTITTSVDPSDLPLGSAVRELLEEEGADLEPTSDTEDLAGDEPVVVVAVDTGDGWHVSLGYSIAEIARREGDLPLPSFGEGIEPDGGNTPEEAFRTLVERSLALDARGVIASLPPGEMAALYDYAPLFLDDIESAADDADVDLQLDDLSVDAEESGDVARIRVASFEISGTVEGEAVAAEFDGECIRFEGEESESEEACAGDEDAPASFDDIRLTAVREGDQWFVSPTRSIFDLAVTGLETLDPEDLEDPEELFGSFLPFLFFGLSDPELTEEEALEEGSFEPIPEVDAEVGDCLDGTDGPLVPCDEPHEYEAYSTDPDCMGDAFTDFVGIEYYESELFVEYAATETGETLCLIYDPGGDTTGSLEGAGR